MGGRLTMWPFRGPGATTLWKKGRYTPICGNKILARFLLQCQVGSSKFKTTAYMVIPPNLPLHCGKFESTITYHFSILTDWSNNDPSSAIGIRHRVLALAHDGMQQSAIVGRVGRTRATINCILWRHAASRTLVPGRFPGGSLEDNTSSRLCFMGLLPDT